MHGGWKYNTGKKIFSNDTSDKALVPRMYKKLPELNSEKSLPK